MNSYEWLAKLVAFDTTSRHSNLALIAFVEEWLTSYTITSRLTYDATGKKANLFVTLPADNHTLDGGLILSGHTDVVPVDGQQWDTDPFNLVIAQDRLYGRGTCDMKGFIAVVLALVPEFKKMRLKYPLHLALSYDEEVGCRGAPFLIDDFQKHGIKPAACIVGEPTEVHAVIAHKGINAFRCRLHGRAAHSSLTPSGCNAIEYAAQFICWIKDLANQFKENQDSYFDVPFTTITSNVISGGTALNIIPSDCEFLFEFRNLPQLNPEHVIDKINAYIIKDLLPSMRHHFNEAAVAIEPVGSVPAFEASENAIFTQLVREILKENAIHKVSYATEAGLFQQAGIPTIVCGPGSIEQAHRANEFVTQDQITKYENFLREMVTRFCG